MLFLPECVLLVGSLLLIVHNGFTADLVMGLPRDRSERVLLKVPFVDHARPVRVLNVFTATSCIANLLQERVLLQLHQVRSSLALLCNSIDKGVVSGDSAHLAVNVANELGRTFGLITIVV